MRYRAIPNHCTKNYDICQRKKTRNPRISCFAFLKKRLIRGLQKFPPDFSVKANSLSRARRW